MAKNPKNKGMYIIMFKQSVLDRIEVIAHSGIRIDGEKVIYIDPVLVNGEPHDADILLFTHPHTDHFSPKDAKKLLKHDTVIAMPKSMTTIANLKLGRKSMPLLPGQTYELCGIKIRTVAAYNTKKLNHMKAKKWLGYIITIDETDIYISGDTDITAECQKLRRLLLNGIIHRCLHKLVIILPDKGNQLVQFTENDLFQNNRPDKMRCTLVFVISVNTTFQMFLICCKRFGSAQIHLLSAVRTVDHTRKRIDFLMFGVSALILAKFLHQTKLLLSDDRFMGVLKD